MNHVSPQVFVGADQAQGVLMSAKKFIQHCRHTFQPFDLDENKRARLCYCTMQSLNKAVNRVLESNFAAFVSSCG
jgi:hypothetical protein